MDSVRGYSCGLTARMVYSSSFSGLHAPSPCTAPDIVESSMSVFGQERRVRRGAGSSREKSGFSGPQIPVFSKMNYPISSPLCSFERRQTQTSPHGPTQARLLRPLAFSRSCPTVLLQRSLLRVLFITPHFGCPKCVWAVGRDYILVRFIPGTPRREYRLRVLPPKRRHR